MRFWHWLVLAHASAVTAQLKADNCGQKHDIILSAIKKAKRLADKHLAMYAEGFSLPSAGQYLVFDSSDLSIETMELFCIYVMHCF